MSEELPRHAARDPGESRDLTRDERILLQWFVKESPKRERLLEQIDRGQVVDAKDGGMGSIRFISKRQERKLGLLVAEACFVDEDGVDGFVQINLDDAGDLFEMDIWKADFSSLRKLPLPGNCRKMNQN